MPTYHLPACMVVTDRRYRCNRFLRFYRQPVQVGSTEPGAARRSPTAHVPYSARLFVNFTKLFPIHFSVFMIHLILISTPDTVPRGVRPGAAAGTRLPG